MKKYKQTKEGNFSIGSMGFPFDLGNLDYNNMLAEVEAGEAEVIAYAGPEKTSGQLIAELEASLTPRNLRGATLGDDYALKKIKEVDDEIAKLRG